MDFVLSERWRATYPGASVGVLVLHGVCNPAEHAALDAEKAALETALRAKYAGYDRPMLRTQPILQAYHAYYKRFKKSYHVQLQLESLLWKGKGIPRVAGLVEAMFMAELKNHLLTSGHDLDVAQPLLRIEAAQGGEAFVGIDGRSQALKPGDMFIADAAGILSSVIYGPDQRTRITAETTRVVFTVYAPPGVGETAVARHLQDTQTYVLLLAPEATTELLAVYSAD